MAQKNTSKLNKYWLDEATRIAMEHELERLPDAGDRVEVLHHVLGFVAHLDNVQHIRLEARMVYFRVCFPLFDYLRQMGQMQRTKPGFDDDVLKDIYRVCQQLINKYRHE